jgi:hypothetical protein
MKRNETKKKSRAIETKRNETKRNETNMWSHTQKSNELRSRNDFTISKLCAI